jgi:hypothetical protein
MRETIKLEAANDKCILFKKIRKSNMKASIWVKFMSSSMISEAMKKTTELEETKTFPYRQERLKKGWICGIKDATNTAINP